MKALNHQQCPSTIVVMKNAIATLGSAGIKITCKPCSESLKRLVQQCGRSALKDKAVSDFYVGDPLPELVPRTISWDGVNCSRRIKKHFISAASSPN